MCKATDFYKEKRIFDLFIILTDYTIDQPPLTGAIIETGRGPIFRTFIRAIELGDDVQRARRRKRCGQIVGMAHVMKRFVGKEFKSGQFQRLTKGSEYLHQRIHAFNAQQHHLAWRRRVNQFQGRFYDQAQGAFAGDKQMPQIVATGVLDQAAIEFQHFAPTCNDLEAHYAVAR